MIKLEVIMKGRTMKQEEAVVFCKVIESQLQDAGYYPTKITIKKHGGKNA
jgi:hypothetical protein